MYEYRAIILRVIDGDTVDVDIDLGFDVWLKKQRIRLFGIDAPESRTSDQIEKIFGLASKQRLKELLPENSSQILKTEFDKEGKYGRILGDFIQEIGKVCDILVEEGYAVRYYGQDKAAIELAHLANRQKLLYEGKVKIDD